MTGGLPEAPAYLARIDRADRLTQDMNGLAAAYSVARYGLSNAQRLDLLRACSTLAAVLNGPPWNTDTEAVA